MPKVKNINTINIAEIDMAIEAVLPDVIEIRHYIHARPELSLQERETSGYIRKKLSALDMELLPPFLGTDVVAVLNPQSKGKNITLRADTDALPITENNKIEYASQNPGIMHACGHDGHTAMLIGAAQVLSSFKDRLDASVRFVFQPGEEVVAAGKDLVETGFLNTPSPSAVIALHGWPGYPVGSICSRPGNMMAASDHFRIVIKGKGGHGSVSSRNNNPAIAAARVISKLDNLSEKLSGTENPLVISTGSLHSGNSANVIPSEATIEGTVRHFRTEKDNLMPVFKKTLERACKGPGLSYELSYDSPYIPTRNNSAIIEHARGLVKDHLTGAEWIELNEPVMSSEDFSYYIKSYPGAMFFLGMGEESRGLHTNNYNFNDNALKNGISFLVNMALSNNLY